MEFNLENYKVSDDKEYSSVYYIPEYLTEEEEKSLLDSVGHAPKPKWTQLSNRRLQNYGGIPHEKGMIAEAIPNWLKTYTEKLGKLNLFDGKTPNHVLVNEYTPGQGIMPHLDGSLFYPTISTINLGSHTLLKFYHPIQSSSSNSQETNGTSTCATTTTNNDNSEEASSSKPTTTSSFQNRFAFSLLLQPRSLVILKDRAYDHFLHGIDETNKDTITSSVLNAGKCGDIFDGQILRRSKRVSLTIRYVPKTTKVVLKLGR